MNRDLTRLAAAIALLALAGCVQPAYYAPPPIALQPYPPPVTYETNPAYRAPLPAPAAEPLPLLQPLPPAQPPASADDTGPIPLNDMPAPVTDTPATATPAAAPAATQSTPASATTRTPTTGPGSNVPLEGFRPMRGQTRPAS